MDIQWYPGHMTKARRQMQEDLKLIDLLIELVDARLPFSSRNPDIRDLGAGKARMIILNKADLADDKTNQAWLSYYREQASEVFLADSRNRSVWKQMQPLVRSACKEKIERDAKRGIRNRPVRAMVVGIPNVGKSTLINACAGRASAKTGDKPGVTKGKQWIHLSKELDLLDTPGILWPRFEDPEAGKRLAMIGSIRDEILNTEELAAELIAFLRERYPGALDARYGVEESGENYEILGEIAKRRNCLVREGLYSTEKAAIILLDEFRGGKLGRISLEKPKDIPQ